CATVSSDEPVDLGDLDHRQTSALRSELVARLRQSLLTLEQPEAGANPILAADNLRQAHGWLLSGWRLDTDCRPPTARDLIAPNSGYRRVAAPLRSLHHHLGPRSWATCSP